MFCNGPTPSTSLRAGCPGESLQQSETHAHAAIPSIVGGKAICARSKSSLTTSAFAGTNQHLALNFSLCRICTRHYLFTLATISIWRVQQAHDAHFY
jgi:hypothetical protein